MKLLVIVGLVAASATAMADEFFLGHYPLPNSKAMNFLKIVRRVYSFRADWATVKAEVERQYSKRGYERMAKGYGIEAQYPDNSLYMNTGPLFVVSIAIEETSVRLHRDWKLTDGRQGINLDRRRRPNPGWITAIVAMPRKDFLKWAESSGNFFVSAGEISVFDSNAVLRTLSVAGMQPSFAVSTTATTFVHEIHVKRAKRLIERVLARKAKR